MARRRKKRKSRTTLGRGKCKIVNTPGGRRKLCKNMRGQVRFKKMSYSPR